MDKNAEKLKYLLQKKIISIGETVNMLRIGIGDEIEVTDRNGKLIKIGTFAVHIQCPWRVVNKLKNKVVLSSYDIDASKELTDTIDNDLTTNSFQKRCNDWLDNDEKIITDYSFNSLGDLKLILCNGEVIEIYVDTCEDYECWRAFETNSNEKHFVVSGTGIEFE